CGAEWMQAERATNLRHVLVRLMRECAAGSDEELAAAFDRAIARSNERADVREKRLVGERCAREARARSRAGHGILRIESDRRREECILALFDALARLVEPLDETPKAAVATIVETVHPSLCGSAVDRNRSARRVL